MKFWATPPGKAGSDQLLALEESVQAQLEQMFLLEAKSWTLAYGVGRAAPGAGGEDTIRLLAQRHECEDLSAYHGGRALELALQLVYAQSVDRIPGREYPGVSREDLANDRQSHNLTHLHKRLLREADKPQMEDALEDLYLESLHGGVIDIVQGKQTIGSVLSPSDTPFREETHTFIQDGAELTQDHVGEHKPASSQPIAFSKMPWKTFPDFLKKADSVYYPSDLPKGQRRNMSWLRYTARDRESGRPRVRIGTRVFARIIRGLVTLSQQPWTWHESVFERWHERHTSGIGNRIKAMAQQNLVGEVRLPRQVKSLQEAWSLRCHPPEGKRDRGVYKFSHSRLELPGPTRTT